MVAHVDHEKKQLKHTDDAKNNGCIRRQCQKQWSHQQCQKQWSHQQCQKQWSRQQCQKQWLRMLTMEKPMETHQTHQQCHKKMVGLNKSHLQCKNQWFGFRTRTMLWCA